MATKQKETSPSASGENKTGTRISHLATLFDVLKSYRDIHYDQPIGAISNGSLYRIAMATPGNEQALRDLVSETEISADLAHDLTTLVRLFSRDTAKDDQANLARGKIEKVELLLHSLVVNRLKSKYREAWWYAGVPEKIRLKAACLHEESGGTIEKESALYLVDLKDIVLSHWADFKDLVADPQSSKRQFESRFGELQELRNRLSHPIRLKENPIDEETITMLDEWLNALDE